MICAQAIDLTLVFGSLYGATIIGAGVIALSGNVVLPLSIIWALVAIGVEAPNSPAGAKYTRAAVKYTALILAAKLAALAAFALKGRSSEGPVSASKTLNLLLRP